MNCVEAIDILLVEDNPQDAELTIRALKKRNLTNAVFRVPDGAAAIDFLFGRGAYSRQEIPRTLKLILLDLQLPKISGLDVLKAAKADDRTKNIPIVILTSSREDPDIQRAYALGANSYVVKPVNFDNFSECVSHLGLYWMLINQPMTS